MEGAEVAAGQLRSPESGVDHRPVPPKGLQELLELLDGQSCDRPVAWRSGSPAAVLLVPHLRQRRYHLTAGRTWQL